MEMFHQSPLFTIISFTHLRRGTLTQGREIIQNLTIHKATLSHLMKVL
jgi:hypothetical protein